MSVPTRAPRARLTWLTAAVLLLASLAGCTLESGGYNTTSPPKIRFFHAGIDLGPVDVTIGNILTIGLFGYEQFASYHTTPTGTQPVTLTQSGGTAVIAQNSVDFANGDRWLYVLWGRPNAPRALILRDNVELPGGGKTKLRFVNAATEQAPIDVYLTAPGAPLDTATPNITGILLGSTTDFGEYDSGSVDIRITTSGTKNVLWDSGQVNLSDRNAYTLVAYARGDPNQVNVGLLTHDTLGSGSPVNSIFASTRAVNGIPTAGAINALIDGTPTITNVAYGTVTPYQAITPGGTRTVSIEPTSTPGTSLVSGAVLFPPGGPTTLVAFVSGGVTRTFTLQDINLLPLTPGNARMRIANIADIGTVNVFANGTLVVGPLLSQQVSLYFELPPASYTFTLADPTTGNTILPIPASALAPDHTYSLFLIGSTAAPGYVLAQDR
jgi:hypothetical protein